MTESLQAPPFVPLQDVSDTSDRCWSALDEEKDEIMGDFLTYLKDTWIGIVQRRQRRDSLYSFGMHMKVFHKTHPEASVPEHHVPKEEYEDWEQQKM